MIWRTSRSSLMSFRFCRRTLATGVTTASLERSRTTVPTPWRGSNRPTASRLRMASRIELRLTPNVCTSSRSGGSMSPGLSLLTMRACSCLATLVYTRLLGIASKPNFAGVLALITAIGLMTDLKDRSYFTPYPQTGAVIAVLLHCDSGHIRGRLTALARSALGINCWQIIRLREYLPVDSSPTECLVLLGRAMVCRTFPPASPGSAGNCEPHLALLCGHHHVVPIENFAMQEFHGQWVL